MTGVFTTINVIANYPPLLLCIVDAAHSTLGEGTGTALMRCDAFAARAYAAVLWCTIIVDCTGSPLRGFSRECCINLSICC